MKRFANPLLLHPRERTGSAVKAAALENAMPPSITVAKRSEATELDRINAMGRTPTKNTAQGERHLEISIGYP